ncbi:MAG: protein kinase [Chloroflexota bacterium]|nr:protein kinase [Chloroflexota bacterium]
MQWNDLIGLQVGQYKVIEEKGRGGAARVFRAYDTQNERDVAFKTLPIETDDRLGFMRRFSREVAAIRSLNHPNIVEVYDSGEQDEFVYLVLAYMSGDTLRKRIASQRLSTQEACQYMIQIALALHQAHQQGIIHRDVKPSNMLLDLERPGQIFLSDFGTAKIVNMAGLTKTGSTVGTPEYMSPEQAQGQEVDQRSDIYSLGCALYETLAGRPPFVGSTPVSVLYQQVHAQPTYIRSYNAEAPRELWAVLRACLGKRPDERYGSAEQLAEALQPFADGLIQPTPAPWQPPVTRQLTTDALTNPTRPTNPARMLREEPATRMPPPFTLAPLPVTPEEGGAGIGPIPLPLNGRAPTSRPILEARGARPTLRLPQTTEGGGGLLHTSMSSEEREALARHERQMEAEERQARQLASQRPGAASRAQADASMGGLPPAYGGAPGSVASRSAPSEPLVPPPAYRAPNSSGALGQRGVNSGPLPTRNGPSQPFGGTPSASPGTASGPLYGQYSSPNSGALGGPGQRSPNSDYGAPRRGVTSGPITMAEMRTASLGRQTQVSRPINVGSLRRNMNHNSLGRGHRRRGGPPTQLIAGVVAVLALIVALGLGGMKLFARPAPVATPRATPRATLRATATLPAPTITPTVAQPTSTATNTPQQILNSQAASAFRAITIAPYSDGACSASANTTTISGAPVFVNLCMADSAAPGPVTVQVRQNGVVVRTLIQNLYPSVGASYTQGHTLAPGGYDMLVTMRINGATAVARDISFTVN